MLGGSNLEPRCDFTVAVLERLVCGFQTSPVHISRAEFNGQRIAWVGW